MPYRSIAVAVCLVLAGFSLTLATPTPAQALAGCCKVRDGGSGQWKVTNQSLSQCKSQNASQDNGDNILKPLGDIWWDITC